ncbi:MAG: aldolase [Ruminococcaceae bacterium]|nr:aldolase [Oscillospiraceae bacterium]
MFLNLMYITNHPEIAKIAESAGTDCIFVDLEYIGKADRQKGLDTVLSHHTFADVANVRSVLKKAKLLVRCNPIHEKSDLINSTEEEIDAIVNNGADIIMLPYFKKAEEVARFLTAVRGRTKTMLLVETPGAVKNIDSILKLPGIDYIHIGLNDLSIGYGQKFLFEPLADGTVGMLCKKFKDKGIPYGFGGIASLGKGLIPSEYIIKEHYRLGSTAAILSRSFCNAELMKSFDEIRSAFEKGLQQIRKLEQECQNGAFDLEKNFAEIQEKVEKIVAED